jgi:predicted nucleic acid-binding protein
MQGVYFADTFYWIAITNPRDAHYASVRAWERGHPTARLVTTEEVLTEVLNWFSSLGPQSRATAAAVVRKAISRATIQVLPQTSADFHTALALYESRLDKEYSLTDGRSMAAMRQLGLTDVLPNDRHFTQEGFTAVFP